MDIAVPIITALAGLVTGIVGASLRTGLSLSAKYDADLRQQRLEAYKSLWKVLAPLDVEGGAAPVSGETADKIRREIQAWYYETGGLLLSRPTQRHFRLLQSGLQAAQEEAGLSDATQGKLRAAASSLRTRMTHDVLSRRGSLLGHDRFAH
jgi:hypothetical protein